MVRAFGNAYPLHEIAVVPVRFESFAFASVERSMLDLNLELELAADSTQDGLDSAGCKGISSANLNQMVESVTSNSSVVNADALSSCIDGEEESCSTRAVTFHFEILKGVSGEEEEKEAPNSWAHSSRSSVDISFQGWKQAGEFLGGGGSGRVVEEPSQPVKKSRRGPRSKSSQYRGVTFYRRTGRWESHIWSFTFDSCCQNRC